MSIGGISLVKVRHRRVVYVEIRRLVVTHGLREQMRRRTTLLMPYFMYDQSMRAEPLEVMSQGTTEVWST